MWEADILNWENFLNKNCFTSSHLPRTSTGIRVITESVQNLEEGNIRYFRNILPKGELWRTYPEFMETSAFLDIETTGLDSRHSELTLIGIADRNGYNAFVKGCNMEDFYEAVAQYDLIITFNGSSFDLPFIETHLGNVFRHTAHIDLMRLLSRIGFRGGLKRIEVELGILRPSLLQNLNGYHAIELWNRHIAGQKQALPTLIRYNAEDVASLPELIAIAFNQMVDRTGIENFQHIGSKRPEIEHLSFDPELALEVIEGRRGYRAGSRPILL